MLGETQKLPEDPAELRQAAEGLVSLAKSTGYQSITKDVRIPKNASTNHGLRRPQRVS